MGFFSLKYRSYLKSNKITKLKHYDLLSLYILLTFYRYVFSLIYRCISMNFFKNF